VLSLLAFWLTDYAVTISFQIKLICTHFFHPVVFMFHIPPHAEACTSVFVLVLYEMYLEF